MDTEVLDVPQGAVLLVRGEMGSASEEHDFLSGLIEQGRLVERGVLVIRLTDGMSVEAVDEDQMREHGWVRATE